jgi:phospholipase C
VSSNAPAGAQLSDPQDRSDQTTTPIKHVILIIGENRTYDHVFGTYTPPAGQSTRNLLSEGIINADGSPGPNAKLATQWQASDTKVYSNHPTKTKPFTELPAMNTGGAPTVPDFPSASAAEAVEPALPAEDYIELASGGTGLPNDVVDTRFPFTASGADVDSFLPGISGPVDMHKYISYDDYASSPVHRFFQMATNGLRSGEGQRHKQQRMSERPVPLGRGNDRRGQQWRPSAEPIHQSEHR